ncbi:MAG: alanine--tRNA ligase [Ignavibacteriae bacterium]|nr:alanine--tRNA ligase [Ignavibacteria bacterium]MBI3364623.1 alanine--tRNA ligase [Ignavibacteriota bacterium]
MTSFEIRNQFLKFFAERGHTIVPSSSVIPYDDLTLLFTNAGMNQFKDVFLGTGKREYVRVADSQKCIRVSGKHNDLEEVGRDTYHHTFFEMLGNWSFGDYYKKEAIAWAWELLTKVWGLEKKRLYATVYESDDEAEQLWKKVTDIDPSHVLRFGKKDNFWEMGETGPCGPCSEIHIDLTDDYSGCKLVNAGDARVMEIWNLVFIQYNRDEKGTLTPLPSKHVDTGMGFERICAVLQKKSSNYETDVFTPILKRIEEISGKKYSETTKSKVKSQKSKSGSESEVDVAMRVIADHVRMLAFSIADGGIPSNEGRGYVMRRILRRAARFGRTLEMHEPFIYKVVEAVVKSMGEQYPEIREKQLHIERMIKGEEESFNATLDRGIKHFENEAFGNALITAAHADGFQIMRTSNAFWGETPPTEINFFNMRFFKDSKQIAEYKFEQLRDGAWKQILKTQPMISGEDAFKLFDTYGFPLDLTEMMARERGLMVDTGRFTELMEEQRRRSRKLKEIPTGVYLGGGTKPVETKFVGYEQLEVIPGIIDVKLGSDNSVEGIIPEFTPFYVESGGQVSDTGSLKVNNHRFQIIDVKKVGNQVLHLLEPGARWTEERELLAVVDKPRRRNIERNHTATHIVHEALRHVLGSHLHQQGSLVDDKHLRFDFNHFEKILPDQVTAIEEIVNEKISQSIDVYALNDPKEWLTIEQAKAKYPNVKMFFGDKYGDRVRIVEIDPKFSVELCGGTHVKNTREVGLFKIISESSVASGIRRIEAVTGEGLNQYIRKQIEKIGEHDNHIQKLIEEKERLEKQLGEFKKVETSSRPSLGSVTMPSDTISKKELDAVEQALHQREQTIELFAKSTQDLKKELSKFRVKEASSGIESVIASGVAVDGFKVVSAKIDAGTADELKSLGDALRAKLTSGVGVLGAVVDEKVALVCVVTDDLIKSKNLQAGKIVGEIAKRVGGGGGGRPHLATAGGKDIAKLDDALKEAPAIVQSMLNK